MSNNLVNKLVDKDFISAAIRDEMEILLEAQADSIIKDAKQKIEKAIRNELASVALKTMNFYNVEKQGENVVITVRNEVKF